MVFAGIFRVFFGYSPFCMIFVYFYFTPVIHELGGT
jgi:hypothetical protein